MGGLLTFSIGLLTTPQAQVHFSASAKDTHCSQAQFNLGPKNPKSNLMGPRHIQIKSDIAELSTCARRAVFSF
jgi:hypothetical protein